MQLKGVKWWNKISDMSAKCACKMKMFMSNLESLCCHLICIIQTNCLTTFDEVVNHNIVVL
jgi:hypothetical protein